MFPPSPYAWPTGSFLSPVPVPDLEPDAAPTVQLCINQTWAAYVAGALKQLLLQSTWDTTDPALLTKTQGRVFNLIAQLSGDACMQFRVKPSDVCILQESLDGGATWADFWDVSQCVNNLIAASQGAGTNPSAPGQSTTGPGGATQPPAGGCFQFAGAIGASGGSLIPQNVTPGMTITLIKAEGLVQVANAPITALAPYFCENGHQYILGACGAFTSTDPNSPIPGDPVGELILAAPDGTYHRLNVGDTYTVPTGMTAGNFAWTLNVPGSWHVAGQFNIQYQVCNNLVGITYATAGQSGPSTVQYGVPFNVVAQHDPNASCGEPDWCFVWFNTGVNVKLTVVALGAAWPESCDNLNSRTLFNTSATPNLSGACRGIGNCPDPTGGVADPCRQAYIENHVSAMTVTFRVDPA